MLNATLPKYPTIFSQKITLKCQCRAVTVITDTPIPKYLDEYSFCNLNTGANMNMAEPPITK